MSLTAAELDEMALLLADAAAAPGPAFAAFRSRFPGRTLTRCDAADLIGAESVRRLADADLYLVDGRNHCWQLTTDPAAATGVVLAARARP
jgi:hypothetical protein